MKSIISFNLSKIDIIIGSLMFIAQSILIYYCITTNYVSTLIMLLFVVIVEYLVIVGFVIFFVITYFMIKKKQPKPKESHNIIDYIRNPKNKYSVSEPKGACHIIDGKHETIDWRAIGLIGRIRVAMQMILFGVIKIKCGKVIIQNENKRN